MTSQQLANFATTTLASAITSTTATSISITSATHWPSSGNFRVLVDSEVMLCTAISGMTLTVVRGYELTTAATHLSGSAITFQITAGTLRDLMVDYFNVDVIANRPTAGILGRRFQATDYPLAYWDNGTHWQLVSQEIVVPYEPVIASSFTQNNFQTGTTTTQIADSTLFQFLGQGTDQLQYLSASLTSTTAYTITTCVDMRGCLTRQYTFALFGLKDSISGKMLVHGLACSSSGLEILDITYTTNTGGTEVVLATYPIANFNGLIFLQMVLASGAISLNFSFDGNIWYQSYSGTLSGLFLINPNEIIIGVDPTFSDDANNIKAKAYFHYLNGY